MDNLSFNIHENFQDNSVDYAEGQQNASALGAISPLVVGGNPDFNHKPSTLWNYLGINNLNSLQTDCAFKCVDTGLKCTADCGDFDKKCNYTCAREGLNCIKDCMELRPTVMVEESVEEEEMVEVEEKVDRTNKLKMLPSSYDLSYGQFAPYVATSGNSYTINTQYGIYPNLADRTLNEHGRLSELDQLSNQMR